MPCSAHTTTRGLASGGVCHKNPGPRLSPYTWQARVGLAGLGALPAPPLCCVMPPACYPDGAKSAVGTYGPRVSWAGLPTSHTPLRAATILGVCGPCGPPMGHAKTLLWPIEKL